MGFIIQWLCYLVAFAAGSAVAWVIVTMSMSTGSAATDHADATTELIALSDEPETVVLRPGLTSEADTAVLPRSTEAERH